MVGMVVEAVVEVAVVDVEEVVVVAVWLWLAGAKVVVVGVVARVWQKIAGGDTRIKKDEGSSGI